jgi:MFS family permease
LFVIACWIALFAFLPWSVDWYASTYYSDEVGSPEYNRGVWIASWARFYQQLVMAGCSFFMLFVSKSFFKDKHRWNRRQEKLKFRTMWIFTLIGLTVYSACLLVAALTDNPDLAYAAFIVSGIGMAAIFPLNGFQSYHIFSLNVKKHEHTTAIIDNYSDNDTKTVAASPPSVCTDYYDNRQKINAAAMIGQIIILSVTYFGFHFNYKWILVTGSAAGGTAIFLGMLFIVLRPYKFDNVITKDKVLVADSLIPSEE